MNPGTKVAYSVQFLASINGSHSDMAHYRGEVTELISLGSTILATVKWDNGEEYRVNTANLAVVGANMKFCQC